LAETLEYSNSFANTIVIAADQPYINNMTANVLQMQVAQAIPVATQFEGALCLFHKLADRYAQRHGYAYAVGRIGLHAVGDVAKLDFLRGIAHGAGGVIEQRLLLFGRHQAEQKPGLRSRRPRGCSSDRPLPRC